ncbi:hypothetical protein KIN20_038359 [Parelaphostrongylus tenuis]|uniref:MSP domain-containing protein n=1 Tax=Parelaphostrongylus tenuis TaxID=148309 RepID=A0AAD5RIV1_PARTN|nr:hypothetical protein KIN20_038359 [Parelaphostrongylus tenuis]
MSSVPPGGINTRTEREDCHQRLGTTHRMGNRRTKMKRLGVNPACGALDPKEATLMAVSCHAFEYGREVDTNNDHIIVEWCNIPSEPQSISVANGSREWYGPKKNLPIEYNP